jgi:PAS domain S-box-containing protein
MVRRGYCICDPYLKNAHGIFPWAFFLSNVLILVQLFSDQRMKIDQEKMDRVKNALKFRPKGMNITELAHQLQMNRNSVAKYLEILLITGQAEAEEYGTSKVYRLSRNIALSTMMDFSTDMIVIIDSDQRIVQVNERFLKATGMNREALVGQLLGETGTALLADLSVSAICGPGETMARTFERKIPMQGTDAFLRFELMPSIFNDGEKGVTILIEDITTRNQAEIALKERERMYRSVIENIQDVFYRSDLDGNLTLASPSWASILGYNSLDECIGRNIAGDFYVDPSKREDLVTAIMDKGAVSDWEILLKRKDGTPLAVTTNSHLYYDEAGSVLGIEGIFRDNTQRHAAAVQVRQTLSQIEFLSYKMLEFIELSPESDIFEKIGSDLQIIIPGAMIIVNSFNADTGIVTTRSIKGDGDRTICERLLGSDPIGLELPIDPIGFSTLSHNNGKLIRLGIPVFELAFRRIPQEVCEKITSSLNLGEAYVIAFVQGTTLLGNAAIVLHKGSEIPDTKFIETYIRQAAIAIQRKIAEEAVAVNEARYLGIVEDQTDLIARFLPEGKITFVNNAFCRQFQKQKQDLPGQPFLGLLPLDQRDSFQEAISSLNQTMPVQTLETRLYDTSGSLRWFQWRIRAIVDERGTVREYQCIGSDITEMHKAAEMTNQFVSDQAFLHRKINEFANLPDGSDMWEAIGSGVKDILPNAIIWVNGYNPKRHSLTARCFLGRNEREVFSEMIGRDMVGFELDGPENFDRKRAEKDLSMGKIMKIPGDLYVATFGKIPRVITENIEKTLNMGDYYSMGLVAGGITMGNLAINLPKGDTPERVDLLEIYIQLASLALKCRLTEKGELIPPSSTICNEFCTTS